MIDVLGGTSAHQSNCGFIEPANCRTIRDKSGKLEMTANGIAPLVLVSDLQLSSFLGRWIERLVRVFVVPVDGLADPHKR